MTALPAVVRAHQQGIGRSAYRRQTKPESAPRLATVNMGDGYTLHERGRRSRLGLAYTQWGAYYHGHRIGEIMPGSRSDVEAELRQYIADGGCSQMQDVPCTERLEEP